MTDSRFPLLLRPPQAAENESTPECRGLLGSGNKQSRPNNRGHMTVRLGGLDPGAYPMHPQNAVGLGLRKGP